MPILKREFTVEQFEEWDLPDGDIVIHQELTPGGGRWYDYMQVVFRAPDDGLTYEFFYPVGKTELQECSWDEDFYNGIVEANLVKQINKTIVVTTWEAVRG